MMDNPDIYLNTCRTCMGSGEIGLGFHQECPVCSGTGSASQPDDDWKHEPVSAGRDE